ncbi:MULTISPECIES: MFS transporter [unclassified Brevibacterium]|uniref:MFS transporter n=1 Tax=unclassified Brevibacterium TaxID=2614124 RepID=UPI0008A1E3B6|nr:MULTISPECIES: MFS transporter [unclassified Brevibacterium]OFL68039.1 MFS transporter [Brevibacterium sp. HMSC063G07]OFS27434.1 MFS transporter [Brevibacterium sp. HMSC07C04]
MFSAYRDIFRIPGTLKFSAAGLIARLPIALLGLGLVLFIQEETGSYAQAGVVAATFMTAQAISNPLLGKQIDRHGQAKIMVPATIIHVTALMCLLLVVYLRLWPGLVFASAAIAGGTVGSVGALVRARWAAVTKTQKELDTAFSWEAVADELMFVSGPAIVTALATALWAPSGIVLSVVAVTIGSLLLYPQKATEPPTSKREPRATRGKVLGNPGILLAVFGHFFLGVNFGAIDVSTIASAEEHGMKSAAGIALAAHAFGSLIAGIAYGAVNFRAPVRLRYAAAAGALALLSWPLMFAPNIPVLAVFMLLVGLTVSPTIITGSSVVQSLAPPKRMTEALAWISTAIGFGIAIGSAVSGVFIDRYGAHEGYLVAAVSMTVGAIIILAANRAFEPQKQQRVVLS